jgi:transposase
MHDVKDYLNNTEVIMDISNYKFSDEEIARLQQYRDSQEDARLRLRFIAILMLAVDTSIKNVAVTTGVSMKTIENWHRQYLTKGIDCLNSFQYKPKQPYLSDEQTQALCQWVKTTNPSRLKQIRAYIIEQFGIKYTIEAIRKLLHKHKLKLIQPKLLPGNPPSEDVQKNKIAEYFEMKSNCEPGTAFLFGDGMHLIHQNIPQLCWGDPKAPPILKTNTGRERLNILGAYNPDNQRFIHITGEENCDANRVIKYFEMIIDSYRHAPKIILFLDNAKYFKAKIVRDWLKEHPKLHIEFLPAYAPNLNLIERFWRFAKEKLVKNSYCPKYKVFRAKVFSFLNHVDQYADELRTLMVENFQIVIVPQA